jgi:hypothetical protein
MSYSKFEAIKPGGFYDIIRPLHYMLLTTFNVVKHWPYAQIITQKKYAQISKKKIFKVVFDTPEAFFLHLKCSNLLSNGLN